MCNCNRKKYYMAEQERLVDCAETLKNIFSQDCAVDYIDTAKDILREMFARLDTWGRLKDGYYENFCTDHERDLLDTEQVIQERNFENV